MPAPAGLRRTALGCTVAIDWIREVPVAEGTEARPQGRSQRPDDGRHFGLVVDDKTAVRATLAEAGVEVLPGPFLDFLDPWGNRIEIVGYDTIQFTKAPHVLRGMGPSHLGNGNCTKLSI